MFPGLEVRDWQEYRDSGWLPDGRDGDRTATRTLILTNRRIIVLDEAHMHRTSITLGEVEDVSAGNAPGEPDGRSPTEAMVEIVVRADSERRHVRWTTGRRDAEVFAEMVRDFRDAIEREKRANGAGGLPPPRTGYTVPVFDADEAETALAAPLPNGLKFGDSLIPWADFERITVRQPGEMIFMIRLGTSSCALFPGWVIRVPDLGDDEATWRKFIVRRRRTQLEADPSGVGAGDARQGESPV